MTLAPNPLNEGKRCFVYCGDDRCNCGMNRPPLTDRVEAIKSLIRDALADMARQREVYGDAAMRSAEATLLKALEQ